MSIAEPIDVIGLITSIRAECKDDYVGLWSIVRDVRNAVGDDPAAVKRFTLDILSLLLQSHLIEAGVPTKNGKGFQPWPLPPDTVIKRVSTEWDQLGRDPDIGEIVWFTCRPTRRSRPRSLQRPSGRKGRA